METKLVNIHVLARTFGLPVPWLKAEAAAGRIPHLRAGRKWLFNLAAVESALLGRAAQPQEAPAHE